MRTRGPSGPLVAATVLSVLAVLAVVGFSGRRPAPAPVVASPAPVVASPTPVVASPTLLPEGTLALPGPTDGPREAAPAPDAPPRTTTTVVMPADGIRLLGYSVHVFARVPLSVREVRAVVSSDHGHVGMAVLEADERGRVVGQVPLYPATGSRPVTLRLYATGERRVLARVDFRLENVYPIALWTPDAPNATLAGRTVTVRGATVASIERISARLLAEGRLDVITEASVATRIAAGGWVDGRTFEILLHLPPEHREGGAWLHVESADPGTPTSSLTMPVWLAPAESTLDDAP
ncbi:MAG: hypothetical protein H0V12_05700 [Chloroflexi bacterium]|nr:hypothetical protein [Chloroflexota bacterium]